MLRRPECASPFLLNRNTSPRYKGVYNNRDNPEQFCRSLVATAIITRFISDYYSKMRSAVVLFSFVALTTTQSIEISLISAALSVVVTNTPVTGTSQSISAQPTAAAASISSVAVQSSAAAQSRHVPVAFGNRDGTCAPQPLGAGSLPNKPFIISQYL